MQTRRRGFRFYLLAAYFAGAAAGLAEAVVFAFFVLLFLCFLALVVLVLAGVLDACPANASGISDRAKPSASNVFFIVPSFSPRRAFEPAHSFIVRQSGKKLDSLRRL